jgi:hypothetical protein
MAHIDPATGLNVPDDDGPIPVPDAGSLGEQSNPALPPVLPQPPPGPPRNLIKADEPITITPGPDQPPPAAVPPGMPAAPALPGAPPPVLPPASTPPAGRPQLVTSQKLTSPEQVDALKNVDAANAKIRDNSAQAGDLSVEKQQLASLQADDLLKAHQAQADARAKVQAAFERQQAIDNANIEKARADGLKDPDAGQSWTHRLMRALVIGLGQYAATVTHTENMAATIFERDRKEKRQAQVDKLNAAKETGKLTQDQYRSELAALDAKDVGQIEAFKARWQAESARLGIPQARIDANANTLALDKQAAEARQKLLNEDRVTVRDETPAELKAGKAKGGGGGSDDALAKFATKAGQLGPGDTIPSDLVLLGRRAGLKANQIAAEVDKYRMSADKAASANARANGSGAGGIGSVRQNAVLGNLAEAEKAAKDITPGGVSLDSIRQLQTNEETSTAAHHSAQSGMFGNLMARGSRAIGAAARGRYDGIPEDQQKKITAAEQVITHLTEMQQGKNIETLEQYRDRYSPYVPGLSEAEVRRREKALPGLVAEQRAIQDPKGVGRQRVQAAEDPRIEAARAVAADPARFNRLNPAQKAAILKAARTKAPADNGGNPNDDITL